MINTIEQLTRILPSITEGYSFLKRNEEMGYEDMEREELQIFLNNFNECDYYYDQLNASKVFYFNIDAHASYKDFYLISISVEEEALLKAIAEDERSTLLKRFDEHFHVAIARSRM